jgi:hypothetical protein
MIAQTTTNQKRAGATQGGIERWRDHQGAWEGVYIHHFGDDRVGSMLKTKTTSLSLQIIFFLRPMISATKILSPRPQTTHSEEAPGGGVSRFD